jgi:hypothetical protein
MGGLTPAHQLAKADVAGGCAGLENASPLASSWIVFVAPAAHPPDAGSLARSGWRSR